ncbi:MAG: laccase domain-containing protein, partial [Candidatus Dechloromonas phosphoritropha]
MGEVFVPDWAAPANVKALQTTRNGGCSREQWASFNVGDHVGDDPAAVAANRQALRATLPGEPRWLRQVHGIVAVDAGQEAKIRVADAAFARRPGTVCAVMTADCLPVLLCDRRGSVVAAAHAGWRGLLGGVLE